MSKGREEDPLVTARVLKVLDSGKVRLDTYREVSWLRHKVGRECGCIDLMLAKRSTMLQMVERIEKIPAKNKDGKGSEPEARIRSHFGHLKKAHGIKIKQVRGVYSFA